MEGRRWVLVRVPADVLVRWFSGGEWARVQGLPEGARAISVSYCFESDTFHVRVFHSSFREVPQGEMIPFHPMEFEIRKAEEMCG